MPIEAALALLSAWLYKAARPLSFSSHSTRAPTYSTSSSTSNKSE